MSTDPISQFRDAIVRAGLTPPSDIIADGKLRRFATNGKRDDDSGWYVAHADGIPAGAFGDFRAGVKETWRVDMGRTLTADEERAHRERMERVRLQREQEESRRQSDAARVASGLWEGGKAAPGDHPYLVRKWARPYGTRIYRGPLTLAQTPCDGALVLPLRDGHGVLWNLEFITSDGTKRYLKDGRVTGCYHSIGEPNGTVCIAEGFATAASVHASTGHAVACATNAGNLLPVAKAMRAKYPVARIIIAADNDESGTGERKAREAADAVGGFVAMPHVAGTDWNDVYQKHGADAVRAGIDATAEHQGSSGSSVGGGAGPSKTQAWPQPRDLSNSLPPVEAFTPELLPSSLRAWVTDTAERAQAPIEYVAVSAMVSAGAALGRKLGVRPKRRDDWQEYANLWGAVIGPPSWMKSPALDEGKRPLALIESEMLEGYEDAHLEWEADAEAAKVRRDGARDLAKQAARKGRAFDKMDLVAATIPEEPKPARKIVNDATVPALCDVLRANPNGVLVFRDELAGLIAELDREGMEGSRGFYLTGWSGKDGHTQDRIARGTNLRVPRVCLSLLGGIQPSRVAPLLRESIATGGGDGFLARFSLAVWPDSPGEYRAMDREPDLGARETAKAVYRALHELRPTDVGAEVANSDAPFLRLASDAAEMFVEWDVSLRNRLRGGEEEGALSAHLGKYPKSISGLALLIHLADGGRGDISSEAMARALGWAEFLESHARRIYASLGQAHIDAARSLLARLRRGDLEAPFSPRQVYRRGWAHLPDADATHAAVDVLESHHFVRRVATASGEAGGRPSVVYELNPAVRT